MPKHLIRVGGAAKDYGAIAVRCKAFVRRILRGKQRDRELSIVPWPKQDVVAPLGVGVFNPVFGEFWTLFNGGGAGDITETAGVSAPDSNVESPVRQALVDKVVDRDDSGRRPVVKNGFEIGGIQRRFLFIRVLSGLG
jgi:hypothetical protein